MELVNANGEATGAIVAAQIKSGQCYLKDSGSSWTFYPEEKHIHYWEIYPLPVILMLHDPESDTVYWDDVRLTLRSGQTRKSPLFVPRENVLSPETATDLFASCGAAGKGLLSPRDALEAMAFLGAPMLAFP